MRCEIHDEEKVQWGKTWKCKSCNREYQTRWRNNNLTLQRKRTRENTARNRLRNLDHVRSIKEATSCVDCGKNYPHYVMDFDHLPGCIKVASISRLCQTEASLDRLDEEIAKCEVVCANCHRQRTWQRANPTEGKHPVDAACLMSE